MSCWFQTRHVSDTETCLIRRVIVLHTSHCLYADDIDIISKGLKANAQCIECLGQLINKHKTKFCSRRISYSRQCENFNITGISHVNMPFVYQWWIVPPSFIHYWYTREFCCIPNFKFIS